MDLDSLFPNDFVYTEFYIKCFSRFLQGLNDLLVLKILAVKDLTILNFDKRPKSCNSGKLGPRLS